MDGTKKERKARSRSANAADSDNTRAISYRYACVSVQETGEKMEDGRALGWSFGSWTEMKGRALLRARRERERNAEVKSAGTVTGA